jgi:hypothetical protein
MYFSNGIYTYGFRMILTKTAISSLTIIKRPVIVMKTEIECF